MKTFLTDLHVHSRFSRMTSKRLTLANLAAWSRLKGMSVLATGDFTHPLWRQELRENLIRDDHSDLYRLRTMPKIENEAPGYLLSDTFGEAPLFMLQAEISSIYKRDGVTRKVHNLVYMPSLESAEMLCRKLEAIGNLKSDGRPILGLDSQKLLELVLDTDPEGVMIPAHIWTPWFSLFGSKSGFDSLEACFGDLSQHIFALETGLSSNPNMNRCWSALDRLTMISNSDAHSGENIGREATLFYGTPSYCGIFTAIRQAGQPQNAQDTCRYQGTVEFFPEEGKYHLDGHRACGVVFEPTESRKHQNRCPVCGKPLTIGVLHRVLELADREHPQHKTPYNTFSHIPLPELLAELLGVSVKTATVRKKHTEILDMFGSEADILRSVATSELAAHWDLLGESIRRMREGLVHTQGGFDGEYGRVRVFSDEERRELGLDNKRRGRKQASLIATDKPKTPSTTQTTHTDTTKTALLRGNAVAPSSENQHDKTTPVIVQAESTLVHTTTPNQPIRQTEAEQTPPTAALLQNPTTHSTNEWTEAQYHTLQAGPHPVLVIAGPGAGKTHTLIGRVATLLEQGVAARQIVAITFTRRAAAELRERLATRCATNISNVQADTLHALALTFWPASPDGTMPAVMSEEIARTLFIKNNTVTAFNAAQLRNLFETIALHRERLTPLPDDLLPLYERYQAAKNKRNLVDYTDLLEQWLLRLQAGHNPPRQNGILPITQTETPHLAEPLVSPWVHVLVDEIQDLSPLQLALIQALLPESGNGFFGIGDPDQAIYAFRGAQANIVNRLEALWPTTELLHLNHSFRSGAALLRSASELLGDTTQCGSLTAARSLDTHLKLFTAPDAEHEARWIADEVIKLLGTGSHTEQDTHHDESLMGTCSPSDVAVLVRFKGLIPLVRTHLERRGVPVSAPETEPFWNEPRVALLLGLAGRRFKKPLAIAAPNPSTIADVIWEQGPLALLRCLENTPPFDPLLKDTAAFQQLASLWKKEGSWTALLEWLQVRQELDLVRENAEYVRIMTIHAAKGLEFKAVFLPALEDGILPFAGAQALQENTAALLQDTTILDEERRLLYVGLTRAAEAVYLSHATSRMIFGKECRLAPSRFLQTITDHFEQSRLVQKTTLNHTQLALF